MPHAQIVVYFLNVFVSESWSIL